MSEEIIGRTAGCHQRSLPPAFPHLFFFSDQILDARSSSTVIRRSVGAILVLPSVPCNPAEYSFTTTSVLLLVGVRTDCVLSRASHDQQVALLSAEISQQAGQSNVPRSRAGFDSKSQSCMGWSEAILVVLYFSIQQKFQRSCSTNSC